MDGCKHPPVLLCPVTRFLNSEIQDALQLMEPLLDVSSQRLVSFNYFESYSFMG
jgi:hypothetical protein